MQTSLISSKTLILASCTVFAGTFLYFYFQKKSNSGKLRNRKNTRTFGSSTKQSDLQCDCSKANVSAADVSGFKSFFDNKIESFRKDMLAYQLERLVWKNHLSAAAIKKIREEYGKVLLQPSFFILFEEIHHYHLEEEHLIALEREWLQKRGYPVPEDKLKEELERRIFDEEHQKAIQTVKELMPDGQSFVDFV